jgi:hypothetical protein
LKKTSTKPKTDISQKLASKNVVEPIRAGKFAASFAWTIESNSTGRVSASGFPKRVKGAMYIHMFAFRFKPGVTDEQKDRIVAAIRKLRDEIPGILETWVGRNDSPRGQGYDLGGVMKFADKAACEAYGAHPVHQKLLGWLMPLIDPIEVDFNV